MEQNPTSHSRGNREAIWRTASIIFWTSALFVPLILVTFSCVKLKSGNGESGEWASNKSEYMARGVRVEEVSTLTEMPRESPTAPTAGSAGDSAIRTSSSVFSAPAYAQEAKPKIIYTGTVELKVSNLPDSAEAVLEMLPRFQGYLSERNDSTTGTFQFVTLTVRIDSARLNGFLDEVKKLGEVLKFSLAGQEVTEEYMDLEARLKQLRLSEERLLEIMRKSGKLTELLEVERELTNKQIEIERIMGRLRYLDDRISYSTVTITLSTETPPVQIAGFNWGFGDTFKSAYVSLKTFVRGFLKGVIWILVYSPIWVAILVIIWLLYLVGRKIVTAQTNLQKKIIASP